MFPGIWEVNFLVSILGTLKVHVSALGEKKRSSAWCFESSLMFFGASVKPKVFQIQMLQFGHILTDFRRGMSVAITKKNAAGQPLFERNFNYCKSL